MTHNAGEGTTSETEPVLGTESHPCDSAACRTVRDQLVEALHEVRTLRDILDSDEDTADAYIDAFIKRGAAPASWSAPKPNLNDADDRRAL